MAVHQRHSLPKPSAHILAHIQHGCPHRIWIIRNTPYVSGSLAHRFFGLLLLIHELMVFSLSLSLSLCVEYL